MNRVLIVTTPVQDISLPPGALSILAACCEQANADYQILDLNLYLYKNFSESVVTELVNDLYINKFRDDKNLENYQQVCDHLLNQIDDYQPTHVAISVFTYASVLAVCTLLQQINKVRNFKIVLGGLGVEQQVSEITQNQNFGNYCLDQGLADYVIFGEGDIAFTKLLSGNVDYPGINRENQRQITDLNSLPIPSYKKINPRDYSYADQPKALITGSRGCVRKCTFCDVDRYWSKYIYKSGQRIAQEMFEIWKETGTNKFDFSDSLINGSLKTFRDLNRTLIDFKAQNPNFKPLYAGQFICRPRRELKEKDYADAAAAGCETLVVGIESFSESVRNHMKKKFSDESVDWHFAMSAKYNIKNVLLILSGYINETLEDHLINLDCLKKYQVYALSRTIYAINIQINGLELYKGTPLAYNADQYNIHYLAEDDPMQWISLDNPTLTPKERLRRSVELVVTAYKLGYKVLHFGLKVDQAARTLKKVQSIDTKKIINILTEK